MGLFEHFPYTNFHELNLTWFLDTFRELLKEWEDQKREFADLKEAWNELRQFVTDYFDNLDVQQEINNKLDAMARSGELGVILQPFVPDIVSDWLETNLEPTSPPVDKSLSISGAAADAEVTGDLRSTAVESAAAAFGVRDLGTIHTGYVLKTDGKSTQSDNWKYTDFFPCENVRTILFTLPESDNANVLSAVAALAFYTEDSYEGYMSNKTISIREGTAGSLYWYSVDVPSGAKRYRASIPVANTAEYQIIEMDNLNSVEFDGYYEFTTEFTEAQQIRNSWIPVKAGYTYRIYSDNYLASDWINVYSNGTGGAAKYGTIRTTTHFIDMNIESDGYMMFYNQTGYLGDFSVKVLAFASLAVDETPKEYYVAKTQSSNANGAIKVADSNSFTGLLLQLKNDDRKKIIYVDEGDYNIFQEYADLRTAGLLDPVPQSNFDPSADFWDYNVFVPPNTHIIGLGLVRLLYQPEATDTNVNESKTISPLNVAGSCIIENIEIHAKNCRYAIHDDALQYYQYNGAQKVYRNVKAVKYLCDSLNGTLLGFRHCFGCGLPRSHTFTFENCYFETKDTNAATRCLYFHNRRSVGGVTMTAAMSSRIIVKDTVMKTALATTGIGLFLGNIPNSEVMQIRVDVNGCYTNGSIYSADEANWQTGDNPNTYIIKVLNTGVGGGIVIRDTDNQYPVENY